jgi:hypothetical protein
MLTQTVWGPNRPMARQSLQSTPRKITLENTLPPQAEKIIRVQDRRLRVTLFKAWNKGVPVIHAGGDHPADVQCCINHTLGKCKKDSGCKYLYLKVNVGLSSNLANVAVVTAPLGIRRMQSCGSAGTSKLAHVPGSHVGSSISFWTGAFVGQPMSNIVGTGRTAILDI